MASPRTAPAVPHAPATRAAVPAPPAPPPAVRLVRRLTPHVTTTPGRLAVWLAGLVALAFLTGIAGAYDVSDRAALLDDVTDRSGPLSVAALDIYQSLSEADATAASAFLAGGKEPVEMRERYQKSVARATSALATAGTGANRATSAKAVAELGDYLPIYTGLVETARTYNRQGLPIGAAYLREASGLMRERLLPAAQRLYQSETSGLAVAQDGAAAFPWFALVVALATLAALVYAQTSLTRRTNRVFNVGLVLATVATLAAMSWLGVASAVAGSHTDRSRDSGSAEVALLAEARIAASQARSDEAHTLVARGNGQKFEEHFAAMFTRLLGDGRDGTDGLLAQARASTTDAATRKALDDAIATAQRWRETHQRLRQLDADGEYNDAVKLAIGADTISTAALSRQLDEHLARAVTQSDDRFSGYANRARRALFGADAAVVVLMVFAALAAALGMQRRIVEYR